MVGRRSACASLSGGMPGVAPRWARLGVDSPAPLPDLRAAPMDVGSEVGLSAVVIPVNPPKCDVLHNPRWLGKISRTCRVYDRNIFHQSDMITQVTEESDGAHECGACAKL